ncbi:TetR/AcrR family transcriptional regulator [Trichococcus ilyis]|nr:TetR/AcrR family transcriptional regulator [Trichococcus ilyis]
MRYKDENKKEAIYHATMLLLNEIGFSSTSMSKIAKRAGVSASTIYVYFENKNDMLHKLYLETKNKMSDKMFSGIEDDIDVKKGFEIISRNYINFIMENRDEFLFLQQFGNSPYMGEVEANQVDILFEPVYKLAKRGQEENIIKTVNKDLLFVHIETPISELAKKYFRGDFEFTEENISALVEMSWDAIKR